MASNRPKAAAQYRRKHETILRGAAEQFLQYGFVGTSVDKVADCAGVSKQTVYKHFGDKESLFTEFVLDVTRRFGEPYQLAISELRTATDLTDSLRVLARGLIDTVLDPRIVRLRRLVISEVERFPTLGQQYFEKGPGRGIEALAEVFSAFQEQGRLDFDDASKAAAHFTWLVISIPLNTVMLLGSDAQPSEEDTEVIVEDAVSVFLAAYGNET